MIKEYVDVYRQLTGYYRYKQAGIKRTQQSSPCDDETSRRKAQKGKYTK